jgi:hypothetical protein
MNILKTNNMKENTEIILSSIFKNKEEEGFYKNKVFETDFRSDQSVWDKLYEIEKKIENTIVSTQEKVEVYLEVFEEFPSYGHFLEPIYRLMRDGELTEENKSLVFLKFRDYICKDYKTLVRTETEYVLWAEFFENSDIVEESWNYLIKSCGLDLDSMEKIILFAGPVPYHLKNKVFDLLKVEKNITILY